jgi:hypothetical protein
VYLPRVHKQHELVIDIYITQKIVFKANKRKRHGEMRNTISSNEEYMNNGF